LTLSMYWVSQDAIPMSILSLFLPRKAWTFCLSCLLTIFGWVSFAIAESPGSDAESLSPTIENPDVSVSDLTYTDALILGIVEGLTEYLPVSSTGHLILADRLLNKDSENTTAKHQEARDAYLIVIQGGAILAVIIIYWKNLLQILLGLLGRNPAGFSLGLKVLVAFLPAAVFGFLLNDWIEARLFNPTAVAVALIVGAVVMIIVENRRRNHSSPDREKDSFDEISKMSYRGALSVGFLQCLAMWPGMSRSMVTIVGGYLIGLSAKAAAEFSFLLGLLTLSAASAYSVLKSWDQLTTELEGGPVILGLVVATFVAMAAVKWFVGFLSRNGLGIFAYYRILLAIVICIIVWF